MKSEVCAIFLRRPVPRPLGRGSGGVLLLTQHREWLLENVENHVGALPRAGDPQGEGSQFGHSQTQRRQKGGRLYGWGTRTQRREEEAQDSVQSTRNWEEGCWAAAARNRKGDSRLRLCGLSHQLHIRKQSQKTTGVPFFLLTSLSARGFCFLANLLSWDPSLPS